MKSHTHKRSGAGAVKSRPTRSAGRCAAGSAIVVRHGRPRRFGATDPVRAHQPLHLAARRPLPGSEQRLPRAPVPVGLVVGLMDLADALEQPLVLDLAGRTRAGRALVVRGRRHAQDPADGLDAEAAAVLVDVAAHLGRSASSSFAKYTLADFRISFARRSS